MIAALALAVGFVLPAARPSLQIAARGSAPRLLCTSEELGLQLALTAAEVRWPRAPPRHDPPRLDAMSLLPTPCASHRSGRNLGWARRPTTRRRFLPRVRQPHAPKL